jgi:hypothetical protein
MNKTVKTGLIIGALAGIGFFLYNYLKNKKLSSVSQPNDNTNVASEIPTNETVGEVITEPPIFLDDTLIVKNLSNNISTIPTNISSTTTASGGGGGFTDFETIRNTQSLELSKALAQHYLRLQQSQVPYYNTSQQLSSDLSTKQTTLSASY